MVCSVFVLHFVITQKCSEDIKPVFYCHKYRTSYCKIYCKNSKIGSPEVMTFIVLKATARVYNAVMCPKDADEMTNSIGPGEAAPKGAVLSGPTLLAQHICPNI